MTKRRRSFSDEYKQEAVGLVVDHGYSLVEAGRSLGIRGNLIGRWKRQLEAAQGQPGKGKLTPDQERIRDLESEVRRLRMEKDILKKATAIYGTHSSCRKNHEISIHRNAQEGLADLSHVQSTGGFTKRLLRMADRSGWTTQPIEHGAG